MRIPLLVAAACTGLVLIAGCGDDGSSAADDPQESTSASASPSESDSPSEEPTDPPTPTDSPSGSPTADPADLPTCGGVWVAGQTLPARYAGCRQGDTAVPADSRECAFGKPLIIYGDRFYAVPGGPVNPTDGPVRQAPAYQEALRSCSG